jgi:hypothetical protein
MEHQAEEQVGPTYGATWCCDATNLGLPTRLCGAIEGMTSSRSDEIFAMNQKCLSYYARIL